MKKLMYFLLITVVLFGVFCLNTEAGEKTGTIGIQDSSKFIVSTANSLEIEREYIHYSAAYFLTVFFVFIAGSSGGVCFTAKKKKFGFSLMALASILTFANALILMSTFAGPFPDLLAILFMFACSLLFVAVLALIGASIPRSNMLVCELASTCIFMWILSSTSMLMDINLKTVISLKITLSAKLNTGISFSVSNCSKVRKVLAGFGSGSGLAENCTNWRVIFGVPVVGLGVFL